MEDKIKVSFKDTMDKTGLPIVSFTQNDKHFEFIIDTGAEYSIVNSNSLKDLCYVELDESGVIYGIEGNKKETSSIGVVLYIDNYEFTEVFQIVDVSGIDMINKLHNINVVGILGSTFLARYKFIIDYETLHVYGKNIEITNP